MRFTHSGKPGVALIVTEPGRESVSLVGVDRTDGSQLWRHGPWREQWGAACVDLVLDDAGHVFVTTSEQFKRCARFTIDGATLRPDWSHDDFAGYTGGCVLRGGHLFGVSQRGHLTCLDWDTGKKRWSQPGFDEHGTLTAADGKLIVQAGRSGDLFVADASPDGYRELRRFTVFEGDDTATFTARVLANGRLYCRSYAGELVCLDLRPRD